MSGARCRTLYPFSGERHGQGLRFAAGELITLLQVPDGGWWEGEKEDGLRGWFPASYVQLLELHVLGGGEGCRRRLERGQRGLAGCVPLAPGLRSTSRPL
ncbi:Growth arrest-specific protein 7 [Tupaia chinensis]|uniref:Growth arrest-specific protein 7 n=1 Tax=Tupaia chinensis TaxID=246437 RepID=L9JRW1_TUPCH|nr:Growth arrest-specific protein 7 [Tupaia chinensis]